MRLEVSIVFFFSDKQSKDVQGYMKVNEMADEDDILDEMAEFVEDIAKDYVGFTTGVAQLIVEDELYQIAFKNPQADTEEKGICNLVIPDEVTVH